uniref:Putative secreted protein n=1 Tax=Anopheles marajoara TaxID=58244 RepID=A0A2M4BY34_9DIPT
MELSRIKVLHCGVILQFLFVVASPLPYTKYGRTCSDIGCLSSQVCVMAYESCSIGQREGNDCGRYPTCKKNTDPSVSGGPSGVLSLNPAPENTKVVGSGGKDSSSASGGYPGMAIDPNYIFGSVQSTRSPFFNNYPQPGAGSPAVFQPLYPPLNQPPVIPQAPFNFGASPHNPFYPQPHPNPNPTSTEPSLWNQFLYNKQPDKRPRNAASSPNTPPHTLLLLVLGAVVPFLYLRFGICRSSASVAL